MESKERIYLVIDTEGIIFGMGTTPSGEKKTYNLFQEVAIVKLIIAKGRTQCSLLYNTHLDYSVTDFIRRAPREEQPKLWSTYRVSARCNGCKRSCKGWRIEEALRYVRKIIEENKEARLVAKGPYMERLFLAGMSGWAISASKQELPSIMDLTDIGCPRFDDMSPELQNAGFQVVGQEHLKWFHPNSPEPHCCAAEAMSFAQWMAKYYYD